MIKLAYPNEAESLRIGITTAAQQEDIGHGQNVPL